MPSVDWVAPSPLWDAPNVAFKEPVLTEFAGDSFLPDFLALMGGTVPDKVPADMIQWWLPQPDSLKPLTLYQPLHGRYYLITGALVCRQLGLPERTVNRKNGERTAFVLRRLVNNGAQEQAWVLNPAAPTGAPPTAGAPRPGNWVTWPGNSLAPGEERLPLHPVAVCPDPADPAVRKLRVPPGREAEAPAPRPCDGRKVYYGYIPVASREKYLDPLPDPVQALTELPPTPPGLVREPDVRVGEVVARVIAPWRRLFTDVTPPLDATQLAQASLYLLLDLGEYLQRVLPGVFAAILAESGNGLGSSSRALYDALTHIYINTSNPGGTITLAQALKELKTPVDYYPLVEGIGTEPSKRYDLSRNGTPAPPDPQQVMVNPTYLENNPVHGVFYNLFPPALTEAGTPVQVPPEVADMIKADIGAPIVPAGSLPPDTYVLRLVYERPDCDPVLSPRSASFTFARIFDPDAPARHIRIQLPDIKDLRKFKRGVGMETSPDLRKLMDQVNKGMLDGGGLINASAWELGMICSFSISIITLVAFIVMFIFLIAFNFIFWWLPFLKICFPIPVKKQ